MKLIDILNLVAKGELEEGTKISFQGKIYTFGKDDYSDEHMDLFWTDSDGEGQTLFENYYLSTVLGCEVEIISKDTNAATKIEELTLEKSDLACQGIHAGDLFRNIESKLNEVIRELNRRGE